MMVEKVWVNARVHRHLVIVNKSLLSRRDWGLIEIDRYTTSEACGRTC